MKSIYTLIFLAMLASLSLSAQTTITNSGFTYTPNSANVNVGDQVTFNMDFTTHPLHEVDSNAWANNMATQLTGGFSATSGTTFSVTMNATGTRYFACGNHASLGMKGRLIVSNPNGIENISSVVSTTYPNPASDQLHIVSSSAGAIHYALIDMLGQTVLQQDENVSGPGVTTLDISGLTTGTYILSSTSQGVVGKTKVQITH